MQERSISNEMITSLGFIFFAMYIDVSMYQYNLTTFTGTKRRRNLYRRPPPQRSDLSVPTTDLHIAYIYWTLFTTVTSPQRPTFTTSLFIQSNSSVLYWNLSWTVTSSQQPAFLTSTHFLYIEPSLQRLPLHNGQHFQLRYSSFPHINFILKALYRDHLSSFNYTTSIFNFTIYAIHT